MEPTYDEVLLTPSFSAELFEILLPELLHLPVEQRENQFVIAVEHADEALLDQIRLVIGIIADQSPDPLTCPIEVRTLKNEDWVEQYKKSVDPVEVFPFYIRPSWHPAKEGLMDIVIDPDLVFGTGHHPTTRTCLQAIARYTKPGASVLDVGCGSGILALAAARMGADVSLCDTDKAAIIASQTNFGQNGLTYRKIWEGSANQADETYDITVANIVADVLIFLKKPLKAVTKPGGLLILSGIMARYEARVRENFADLETVETFSEGEWRTLVLRNRTAAE